MNEVIDLRRYPDNLAPETTDAESAISTIPHASITQTEQGTRVHRGPLGQMPIHTLQIGSRLYVANAIKDLMLLDGYNYDDVRILRHASNLVVPNEGPATEERYFDFNDHLPAGFDPEKTGDIEYAADFVRDRFDKIVDEIVAGKTEIACLLSGGVDSMVAAFLTAQRRQDAQTYTMGLSSKAEDLALADEYAKAFGMKHNVIQVSRDDIITALKESVWRSEIYHLYNVYCAVGMVLIGRHLARLQIHHAMSGEGANEAFGDYHNWDMKKKDGTVERIQSTDIGAFNSPEGRHAYVWGNPRAEEKGFFNQQLGSGLAKHGMSRMYKPLNEYGVQLYSPFMQVDVLKIMASIPEDQLAAIGGKPGFMALVFRKDIAAGKIPADFFANKKKTRLQDANPDGQGGITETLLRAGFSQEKVVEMYNKLFGASIKNDSRFTDVKLK